MSEKSKNSYPQGCDTAEQVNVSNEVKAKILDDFLDKYLEPAFGSLSKTEIDMLVLELLEQTGRIKENDNQYTLSKKLKISQARAKNLLYNRTLRKNKKEDLDIILDNMTKELLQKPTLQKASPQDDCKWLLFYIENPLLIEHIRDKICSLKHIHDGSFSPHIIKLSIEAFAALVEHYIPNKNEISKDLKKILPDKSLSGLLVEILRSTANALSGQVAGKAGTLITDKTFDYLQKLWQNNHKTVSEQIKNLAPQI